MVNVPIICWTVCWKCGKHPAHRVTHTRIARILCLPREGGSWQGAEWLRKRLKLPGRWC
ncbi:hypothetical protein J0S82_013777 [Galemys pyrenaicus]|uniref:Uncharacterized protein n=1 Tax=Galemys pyrenaicus TaxID=202257 RepID=A0A8J5ZMP9_GALPY|nr:hypothetical protein J0S82_013777 [Galemys pyrenaicus]